LHAHVDVLQAAFVFDSRFAALHNIWRDMPIECVKVCVLSRIVCCLL
jgi:hypothetical protein